MGSRASTDTLVYVCRRINSREWTAIRSFTSMGRESPFGNISRFKSIGVLSILHIDLIVIIVYIMMATIGLLLPLLQLSGSDMQKKKTWTSSSR